MYRVLVHGKPIDVLLVCKSERVDNHSIEGTLFSSDYIKAYTNFEVYLQFQRKFGSWMNWMKQKFVFLKLEWTVMWMETDGGNMNH
jgi:hypothetical protein